MIQQRIVRASAHRLNVYSTFGEDQHEKIEDRGIVTVIAPGNGDLCSF
jgi:hypothetical protein